MAQSSAQAVTSVSFEQIEQDEEAQICREKMIAERKAKKLGIFGSDPIYIAIKAGDIKRLRELIDLSKKCMVQIPHYQDLINEIYLSEALKRDEMVQVVAEFLEC